MDKQQTRTVVLRKTVGQFSAGTRVNLDSKWLTEYGGLDVLCEATYTHVERYTDFEGKNAYKRTPQTVTFEVLATMLTVLRSKSELVPSVARKDRPDRVARQKLYEMLHNKQPTTSVR